MLISAAGASAVLVGLVIGVADRNDDEEDQELIRALPNAKVTLQQGLTAGEQQGQPIFGKFEIASNKLQLSVYSAKDDKFVEAPVNCSTGKIEKVERITRAFGIGTAYMQKTTMMTARLPLKEAVARAASTAGGFSSAVSVVPDLKDGHAWAAVVLVVCGQSKTILVSLE